MNTANELNNLVADVEDLIGRVGDAADPELRRIRDNLKDSVAAAKQTVAESSGIARRQLTQWADRADKLVRVRPWQAAGIAAAVGVALGLLAGRRADG